jgi:hypothetical protein
VALGRVEGACHKTQLFVKELHRARASTIQATISCTFFRLRFIGRPSALVSGKESIDDLSYLSSNRRKDAFYCLD